MLRKDLLFLLMVCLVIFTGGCMHESNIMGMGKNKTEKVQLYYPDNEIRKLVSQEVLIEKDLTTIISEIMEFEKLSIPSNTKILDISQEKNIIYLDFSEEFATINYMDLQSIIYSLCSNELNIDGVQFLINGEIRKEFETSLGDMNVPQYPSISLSDEYEYIKLIYPDSDIRYWLIEEKVLNVDPQIIMNEIIKSEANMIPKDTKLLGITIKENIAFVNLSKEFETSANGDTVILININTIVNTLCINDILGINKVLFLVNGEQPQLIGPVDNDRYHIANLQLQEIY